MANRSGKRRVSKVGTAAKHKAAMVRQKAEAEARREAAEKRRAGQTEEDKKRRMQQRYPKIPGVDGDSWDGDMETEETQEETQEEDTEEEDTEEEQDELQSKLGELQAKLATVKKQLEKERGRNKEVKEVPDTITAEGTEIRTELTDTVVATTKQMSVVQQKAALDEKEVNSDIREKINSYVSKQIFNKAKFAMTTIRERSVCMHAVTLRKVVLPEGVTPELFAQHCSKMVRERMNKLRSGMHSSCKLKFDSKCRAFICDLLKQG